ncbi:MAG: hypothetical protein R6V16_12135 [Bacteroidales bacterium]
MKKILLIACFCQLFNISLKASDSTIVEREIINSMNRSFYLNQIELYKTIPANLWLWEYNDFSTISINGSLDQGSFKQVDEFDKNEQFSFKSESVQSFEENGWRFYGSFIFNTSNHEDANWNLGFEKSEIGNPFRLLIQRNGDFNVKQYGLNGIMNKKLGNKFSLGVGIDYRGDLYFRLSDTRNEFYNLKLEFTGAVSYAIKESSNISLGVSYFYKKAAPDFINEFKTNGPEYYLYINEGLGDFNKINLSQKFYFKNQNPKYYISYFSGDKNLFSLMYSAYIGEERWDYKITSTLTDTDKELYKYEYFSNEIISSYLINEQHYKSFNSIELNYINGTGYKNRGTFQKTYIYDGLKIDGRSELLRADSDLFYLSSMNIYFEKMSKKDMIYAHQIDYTNIKAKLKTGYSFGINANNKLSIDIEGAYKHNLSYMHDVVSAGSKLYTLNLAYNEVAYHTANYYTIGGQLKWNKQLENIGTELRINYSYLTPTDVKLKNQYSMVFDTQYRCFWEANLSFYF